MIERRYDDRRTAVYYLEVLHEETGLHIGNVENISPTGLLLTSELPLERNRNYLLQVKLPSDLPRDREYVTLQAQAVWSRRDEGEDLYRVGLRINYVSPDDREPLSRFLGMLEAPSGATAEGSLP